MKGILYIVIGIILGAFVQEEYKLLQTLEKLPQQAQEWMEEQSSTEEVSTTPCNKQEVQSLLTDLDTVGAIEPEKNGRGSLCEGENRHAFFPSGKKNVREVYALRKTAEKVNGINLSISDDDDPQEAPWVTVTIEE